MTDFSIKMGVEQSCEQDTHTKNPNQDLSFLAEKLAANPIKTFWSKFSISIVHCTILALPAIIMELHVCMYYKNKPIEGSSEKANTKI